MSTPVDLLEWIRTPLEEMKQAFSADPSTPWEERRASFLHQLGLQDASQHPVVQQLLEHLDQTPEEERNRVLGSNELDSMASELVKKHAAGQASGADGAAGYDEQAWQAFLVENGPRWDGTDASWDQFRQWFAYYADQQGFGAPATALLAYLATQPAAERVTTFAQYGVAIARPQPAAAQGPAAAGQVAQEAEQPADGEVSAAEAESITGDALKAHPEIADMPEEERIAAMSEVLNRLQAG
jgi:hypothetical protein